MKFKRIFHYYFGTLIGSAILIFSFVPWINALIFFPVFSFFAILVSPLSLIGILNVISLLIIYLLLVISLLIFEYAYLYKFRIQKIALVVFYLLHLSIFYMVVSIYHANTDNSNSDYLLAKIASLFPLFGICFDLAMKKYYKEKRI
jgi:hypothetical protein